MRQLSKSWLRIFSGFLTDMSAAWVATIVVISNFAGVEIFRSSALLTVNLILATVSLLLAVRLDEAIYD
jgi:hypothetical protein